MSSDASSYVCNHCGNEHLLERDSDSILLEAFAKCPKCGRNDQVRRVSAIVKSQIQHLEGTTLTEKYYRNEDGQLHSTTESVPFTGKQSSELARQLSPPSKPEKPRGLGCLLWLGLGSAALLALFLAVNGLAIFSVGLFNPDLEAWRFTLTSLGCMVTSAVVALSLPFFLHRHKKAISEATAKYEKDVSAWGAAMEKYRRSYYCSRDDIVFDPEEGTFCDPSQLTRYLYSNS